MPRLCGPPWASEARAKQMEGVARQLQDRLNVHLTQRGQMQETLDMSIRQLGASYAQLQNERSRRTSRAWGSAGGDAAVPPVPGPPHPANAVMMPSSDHHSTLFDVQPSSWGLLQDLHQDLYDLHL